jgi:hypothetical protein
MSYPLVYLACETEVDQVAWTIKLLRSDASFLNRPSVVEDLNKPRPKGPVNFYTYADMAAQDLWKKKIGQQLSTFLSLPKCEIPSCKHEQSSGTDDWSSAKNWKLAEFPEGYELFTHYKGDAMQSVNRKDHYLYGKSFSSHM